MKFISTKTMSLLAAAALTLSLASCGAAQTATDTTAETQTAVTQTQTTQGEGTTDQSSTAPGGRAERKERSGTLGRITAIDGDTVTVEVREMGGKMGGGRMMNPPDFNGGNSDTQQTPPDLPADSGDTQQTPPDLPQNGEENSAKTVTLTLSQITKDGAAVTADDLSVDTFLMITLDEEGNAVSAVVSEGFCGRMGGQMDGQMGGGMRGQPNGQTTDGNSAPTAPADNTNA